MLRLKTSMQKLTIIALLAALLTPTLVSAQRDAGADAALAARLEAGARSRLAMRPDETDVLRSAAASLEICHRLDPRESRYLISLTDLSLRLGDSEKALAWITKYRELQPGDQIAQIQFIDLNSMKMETADDRLNYYTRISQAPSVPNPVRSHAAAQAVRLLTDKGNDPAAAEMLEAALKLNPSNLTALQFADELAVESGDASRRFGTLLALLRANVAQPHVMTVLADQLASVGLYDQAINLYNRAFALSREQGVAIDPNDFLDYAAVMVSAQQSATAEQVLNSLLESDPMNAPAHFLRAMIARKSSNPASLQTSIDGLRGALVARLAAISQTLNTGTPPEPAAARTLPMPDITADIAKIRAGRTDLGEAYIDALADLAWMQLYFDRRSVDDALLTALRNLTGDASPLVARLEGWNFLVNNDLVAARQKLSGIAGADALAEMGMLVARNRTGEDVRSDVRALLLRVPTGVIGAMVADELRPLAGEGQFASDLASDFRRQFEAFPTSLFRLLERAEDFYVLRIDPLKVGHGLGDPILFRITITNKSEFPLTLGPGGVVRPTLVFDAATRGVMQQGFPACAVEEFRQAVVLQPRESATQIVRADGPELRGVMMARPEIALPLYFSVMTNAVLAEAGPRPGPAGYRKPAERPVERDATSISQPAARDKLLADVRAGESGRRVSAIETAAVFIVNVNAIMTENANQLNEEARNFYTQLVDQLREAVTRAATTDESPSVRAWASYLLGMTLAPDQKLAHAERMIGSENWMTRLLSIDLISSLADDQKTALLEKLATQESDDLVKSAAVSAVAVSKLPPLPAPETPPAR
jgi:tetratricopeptide (TPR) repeat protein